MKIKRNVKIEVNDKDNAICTDVTKAEEVCYSLAAFAAERAAERFKTMVDDLQTDHVIAMLDLINNEEPESSVRMLQGMFYAHGMEYAAAEIDMIVLCGCYCDYTYEYFMDCFNETDEIDWYSIEKILREAS